MGTDEYFKTKCEVDLKKYGGTVLEIMEMALRWLQNGKHIIRQLVQHDACIMPCR